MPRLEPEYVYWDACVVQSFLEKWPGRWEVLLSLLRASHDPSQPLRLVTSAWTIAEVAYFGALERKHQLREAHSAIQDFWESDAVQILEFHEVVAQKARDIVRESHFGGWTIKPKDAVHLSSALIRGAREFHTYDKQLAARVTAHYSLKAEEPSLFRVRLGLIEPVAQAEQGVFKLAAAANEEAPDLTSAASLGAAVTAQGDSDGVGETTH